MSNTALSDALRICHPDLMSHLDEVDDCDLKAIVQSEEDALRRIYDEALERAVNKLAGDFASEVDNAWWRKRLERGVELHEFVRDLERFAHTGIVYQVVFGHLDKHGFSEDESMASYVYGTFEKALKCATTSRYHHARIYWEHVDGNKLPNKGNDAMCYPPDSFGNRTSQWMCVDFDGNVHAVKDGKLRPFSMTWRMLRDAIDRMPESDIDSEAYALIFTEDVTYDGVYMLYPRLEKCDTDPDSPYTIDIIPSE